MKTKQEIQLELLQEIDDICSNNGLKYILFGMNALNVYHNHSIKDGPRMVAIAMTSGDIDRFCKIIEEEYNENRYVEGIYNNPNFIPLYVSYGNKNTADFHMVNLNKNKYFGIRIRIYPIGKFATLDGKVIGDMTNRIVMERKFRIFVNKRVDNPKLWYVKTGLNVLNGAYSLTGGSKQYYKKVKNNIFIDKWEDIQNYSKVKISTKEISTEHLKFIEKVDVDGIKLYMPKDQDAFFSDVYGEKFREIPIKARKQKMRVIEDTEVSYKEIKEDTKDLLEEIRNIHEEIIWTRYKAKKESEAVANVWRLVQMTNKQMEFRKYFKENIDELLSYDLDNEEEFEELYEKVEPVIIVLNRYAKYGMTFSIDAKSDALIEKVLLKSGMEGLVKQMKKLAKKQYFVE